MKTKLLMAAVGAALVAGPMLSAHAAATLYGRLHMSADMLDNDDMTQGYIASNSSRFGIKGDEDLGTGLKAIYQVEQSFSADEGTGGTLASRNTFAGLAGDWGTFKIGRHDTPYKELGYRFNRFIEQVGDARNMYGTTSICAVADSATTTTSGAYIACDQRAGFDARADNMLRYDSPKFGGAQVSVLYSNNNADAAAFTSGTAAGLTGGPSTTGDDSGTAGRSLASMTATWSTGPMFLGLGYETHDKATTGAAGEADSETGIRFTGDYTFNDFTVGLIYEMISDIDGVSDLDRTVWGLAAAYKMGNNTFKAHWLDSGDLDCPSGLDCSGTDTSMIAIGVDHAFSKTTLVYLDYAIAEAGDNAVVDVANGYTGHGEQNTPVKLGGTNSGLSLGLMVNF